MSMNFGREQALLRQRLAASGKPELAAAARERHGDAVTFLGAERAEVVAAAHDLTAAHPQMGRAQMTAFVRTLWQSRIHELRAVGTEVLALRAALLEPPDLPFVEGLLQQDGPDELLQRLAFVLATMLRRHKKLWKDVRRLAGGGERARRAALQAAAAAVADDAEAWPRFVELATPRLGDADALVQTAIDDGVHAMAEHDLAAARTFASQHGRQLSLPEPVAAPAESRAAAPTTPDEGMSPPAAVARSSGAKHEPKTAAAPSRAQAAVAKSAAKRGAAKTAATKASATKADASKTSGAKRTAAKTDASKRSTAKRGAATGGAAKRPTATGRSTKVGKKTRKA